MTPVILCGGTGSRLWPLSRTQYPKQYLKLLDQELSLFQQTVKRLQQCGDWDTLVCLTNEDYRFILAHQLMEIGVKAHILLEPSVRNTTAAIAVACEFVARNEDMDNTLLVVPSDHAIADIGVFVEATRQAFKVANQGYLVTFGIQPTHPETGYGYIQCQQSLAESGVDQALKITRFVEKPDSQTATTYLQQGGYFWNSGIFVFAAQVMIGELERYANDILKQVNQSIAQGIRDLDFFRLGQAFSDARHISIDYAIMEQTQKGALIPFEGGWNDVGSFQAMMDFHPKDKEDNTLLGEAVTVDSQDNFVYSDHRLVALLGVNHMVVVDTRDSLLITTKEHTQEVGKIVDYLKHIGNDKAHFQPQIYRPWGWYETLIEGKTFKVKRIHVYSGAKLSLQKHRYRSEHWVVVKGVAVVTCDERTFSLPTNQSTFIPLGSVHRLSNEQAEDLEIIEVQNGTYLGEDDIIRIEDIYQRD